MPAANLVVYRGYVRLTFPVSLGKTAIIQLLFCLIGPTLRPIVTTARGTYRTADSCVLLWEGAWIWRPVDEVQRQPSLSRYPLPRLSFKLTCIISKSEVGYSVYCIFYVWEQAAKRMLKTRECYQLHSTFSSLLKSITKHSADHFETLKNQRLSSFNSVGRSCMVIQIVPLNIVKDGGMFCGGLWKK